MNRRARRRHDRQASEPKPAADQACRYCGRTTQQAPLGAAYSNGNVPMRCGWCMRNYVALARK